MGVGEVVAGCLMEGIKIIDSPLGRHQQWYLIQGLNGDGKDSQMALLADIKAIS